MLPSHKALLARIFKRHSRLLPFANAGFLYSARFLALRTRLRSPYSALPIGGKTGETEKIQKSCCLDFTSIPTWVEAKLDAEVPRNLESTISLWNQQGALFNEGKKGEAEKLWREFFSDPTLWRDHRLDKANPRFPDFKHKKTQKALWLDSKWIPPWVRADLAAIPPGTIESSTFSWNQRLLRFAQAGQYDKTVKTFQEMQQDGIHTDRYTFSPVLNACANLGLIETGRCIHAQIIQEGCEADLFTGSSLVDMYAKCGSIEDAWRVFKQMPIRDVVAWNAMIGGYVKCGEGKQALEQFEQMQKEGVDPSPVTFMMVLSACADLAFLEEGRLAHEQIIQRGFESEVYIGNSLINMYAKCGSIEDAARVFNQMPTRDVVAWNAMILGYLKSQNGQQALELSEQMRQEGVEPDTVTFLAILNACASVGALKEGRCAHEEIIHRGYESDVFVSNCLVDMYAKCGNLEHAERVFNKMPTRDVVTWNAIILGYLKSGKGQQALELFGRMQHEKVEPNSSTFVTVLNACSSTAALERGKHAHKEIIQRGYESNVFVGSSLVDMYFKCGSIEDAAIVFNKMSTRDVVAWNAMIMGCVKCGGGQQALKLYEKMRQDGIQPSSATLVAVLNACASVAALEEGRCAHEEIIHRGYDSEGLVTNCVIDMYAKCGSIEDAERVFNQMPSKDVVTWNAMLAGYGCHGYVREAFEHFKQMCDLVEANAVTFVNLLSACSHGGFVDEGLEYFKSMSAVYNVSPTVEHYACAVDLLGRTGRLHDAVDLISSMPVEANARVWMSLLGACRVHGNVDVGEYAAKQVLEFDAQNGASFVLLSNIYAATKK